MVTKDKVLLIGSGGVGTIVTYGIEYTGKAEVTAVIRSDYDTVKEKGFSINSCDYGRVEGFRPTNITKNTDEALKFGPFDFVVVTTKNLPDIYRVEDLIEPVITEKTVIVLIQNGIDIGTPIIEKYPNNIVLSGVSLIASTNYSGVIEHEAVDNVKIGYFSNKNLSPDLQKDACEKFISIYSNDRNEIVYDSDVTFTRWRKLVYNATLNPICTLTRVDTGRLELFGGVDGIVRGAMKEVMSIAKSEGAKLPESIIEFMIRSDDPLYYSPSMLVDLNKGNYIEVEVICGNAVRVAQRNKVDAPILKIIYELLKVVQCKTKETKGMITVPNPRPVPK